MKKDDIELLKLELDLFRKVLYRNGNQHRGTVYFRSLKGVRRSLQLIVSRRMSYLHRPYRPDEKGNSTRELRGLLTHCSLAKQVR